jgi:hypothetical protein
VKYTNPDATGLLPQVEALLTDTSYDITESALQKLYDAHPEKATLYLAKTKNT